MSLKSGFKTAAEAIICLRKERVIVIKLLGAVLIAGSCSVIGFSMNNRLKGRVAALKSFLGAVQLLQAEIVFRQSALPDILPMMIRECSGAASDFFRQVLRLMVEKNESFMSAVAFLVPELRHFDLKWDEIEWLASVGQIAGRYDAATQADRLSGVIARLEQSLDQAQEEYGQKGRLYRALGLTAGVMIALVAL